MHVDITVRVNGFDEDGACRSRGARRHHRTRLEVDVVILKGVFAGIWRPSCAGPGPAGIETDEACRGDRFVFVRRGRLADREMALTSIATLIRLDGEGVVKVAAF